MSFRQKTCSENYIIFCERSLIRTTNNRNTHSYKPYHLHNAGKAFASAPLKGSITVEASLAVPLFFFAVICLIYLFEIMAVQTSVRSGLQYAGRIAMQESYPVQVLNTDSIEENMIDAIGAERLERSIIIGGSSGIDCSDSSMSLRTGIGKLTAEYRIRLPIPLFSIDGIVRSDSIRIKAWTGYEKEYLGSSEETIVYVTETGLVYHRDYHCTYLDLSIRIVSADNIAEMRNEGGGKYYACSICNAAGAGSVYVTDNGNRYHKTMGCSGLKRTVYAVPLSEVLGKGACKRCGK